MQQKLILLLEEIREQGEELKEQGEKTINLLQQLVITNKGDNVVRGLPFQLPASTAEELQLIDDQAEEGDIKGRLVNFIYATLSNEGSLYEFCLRLSYYN